MNPIDPAELSALLDGELNPTRADEVRAAVERDPALKAELEQLRQLDNTCREAAAAAPFQPLVTIAGPPDARLWAAPAMLAGVLLLVRFLPKIWDLAVLGPLLHIGAFVIVLGWIVRIVSRSPPVLPWGQATGSLGPESDPGHFSWRNPLRIRRH